MLVPQHPSMLEIVIGLVFIFLLYSLLATILMELFSNLFALRGRNLEKALKNMLHANNGEEVFKDFKDNPLYKQLAGRYLGKISPPSYLSNEKFRTILMHVLDKREQGITIGDQINALPEGSLKEVLNQFWTETNQQLTAFKDTVDRWYDDVMDRASGWYKRGVKAWLITIGLIIAVTFNVDTLEVYDQLSKNPETARMVADLATNFVERQDVIEQMDLDSAEVSRLVKEMVSDNLESLENPLGVGWSKVDIYGMEWFEWVKKVFGWIITSLAISLGAPFWFDLLRKLVNIRGTGSVPPPSNTQVIVQPPAPPTYVVPHDVAGDPPSRPQGPVG